MSTTTTISSEFLQFPLGTRIVHLDSGDHGVSLGFRVKIRSAQNLYWAAVQIDHQAAPCFTREDRLAYAGPADHPSAVLETNSSVS